MTLIPGTLVACGAWTARQLKRADRRTRSDVDPNGQRHDAPILDRGPEEPLAMGSEPAFGIALATDDWSRRAHQSRLCSDLVNCQVGRV